MFDGIKFTSCEKTSVVASNEDASCQIEAVDAVVNLNLDPKIEKANCQKKCGMKFYIIVLNCTQHM